MATTGMTDVEFITHLYSKHNPSEDDLEAASRLELILHFYAGMLEQVHQLASEALEHNKCPELEKIHKLTASAGFERHTVQ